MDAESARSCGVPATLADDFSDFVVISHPCDVVARDFAREPEVELLGRRAAQNKDGNLTYGKNPRSWQFAGESGATYELNMRDHYAVPRELLAEHDPIGTLADAEMPTLRRWLSNRYARAAFPDAFNERFRQASSDVTKVLKRDGAHLSGMYLMVDGRELLEDQPYEVVLYATMLEEAFDDPALRLPCAVVLDIVGAALDGCPGISVIECALKSEGAISLSDLRELRRWDYDSLSLREDDSQSPPDEV